LTRQLAKGEELVARLEGELATWQDAARSASRALAIERQRADDLAADLELARSHDLLFGGAGLIVGASASGALCAALQ
jgi:hypothetical protein